MALLRRTNHCFIGQKVKKLGIFFVGGKKFYRSLTTRVEERRGEWTQHPIYCCVVERLLRIGIEGWRVTGVMLEYGENSTYERL